jgi:NAD(P)-dependent dehydrogenase (short-subunit alcohol dehydrogenase family)
MSREGRLVVQKAAVITGSTKGWGRAIAEGLAQAGVRVIVNGRHSDVSTVVSEIRQAGGEANGVQLAADTAQGVNELMARALDAYGAIDIWVNSLGAQQPQPLISLDHKVWDRIIRIQLTAVFLGTQAAARQMIKQGSPGRILNVVGGGAYGLPGASAHASSKGGALAGTVSWAEELRPYGITVNAIRGGVQSPGMRDYVSGMGMLKGDAAANDSDLHELGFYHREEAWPLAVWLASDTAADVTGYHIGIDGPRIVVYERFAVELELYEDGGWSTEALEAKLHSAMNALPPRAKGAAQRRPVSGHVPTFDERKTEAATISASGGT